MTAEVKEAVGDRSHRRPQHLRKDGGQPCLGPVARSDGIFRGGSDGGIGCGQGFAIDLPVGRERQDLEQHKGGGQHVIGQIAAEMFAQTGRSGRGGRAGHDIGHQPFVAGSVFAGDHDVLFYLRMVGELGFDFTELDAKASDLYLMIQPAEAVDVPVGPIPGQIAGAIKFFAGFERMGHKPINREIGAVMITSGQTVAADQQFARQADGQWLLVRVENVDFGVINGAADMNVSGIGDPAAGGPDGGLGRAVHVPEFGTAGNQCGGEVGRHGFAAAQGF